MHEIGIMQNLINTAVERAKQEGVQHINMVHIRLGDASGVVPESLEFAFELAKRGTIAENAYLQICYLPTLCYCLHCGLEFNPIDQHCECPTCHQISTEIRQGKECELDFLDVS